MHVKSNLYDKFKERYSQKREAVVKFHAFVAPLTIFGAICFCLFKIIFFLNPWVNLLSVPNLEQMTIIACFWRKSWESWISTNFRRQKIIEDQSTIYFLVQKAHLQGLIFTQSKEKNACDAYISSKCEYKKWNKTHKSES